MPYINHSLESVLIHIIYECNTCKESQVEITLPDSDFGKEIFLKVSDETKWTGRLSNWTYGLYENNKIGKRCLENGVGGKKTFINKKLKFIL